ncbi:uncharacterized protein DUF4012 [Bogoriella caseilytica]|uniref:Uncharacterized protein DUF4012 n=2 Tax=Bogoriella caseilytica TaxID=56055 RepID=A0A3N2BDK7_9MICO|nr:uncharacterized protein DUF4012 [Bogoriella caseilytica]
MLGLAAGLLVVVVIAIGALLALDARTAYRELGAAEREVSELQREALEHDREDVDRLAASIQQRTSTARDSLNGPHWRLAAYLPWAGENVRAVQNLTATVDDLAHRALGDLVDAVWAVDPANLAPQDGRIDVAPIAEVAPQVVAADAELQRAAVNLAAMEREGLVDQVATATNRLQAQVEEIAELTTTAARAVQLIPPMMGVEGPRHYLVLVQNNAEPRATGGIAGQVILLRADDGDLDLVSIHPTSQFAYLDPPVGELTDEEIGIYSDRLGRYIQNVNRTPDFPRAAELAVAMWEAEENVERRAVAAADAGEESAEVDIDGVLGIDPVALQALLGPAGSVTLPTGQTLDEENTAQILLNQVYLEIGDPDLQNEFFALAADAIVEAVLDGDMDPAPAVDVLDRMAGQGRLMIWSQHAGEQELLAGTILSGELRGENGEHPVIGVYVNELTAAKISYYQHLDVEVDALECRADGSRVLGVEVSVRSDVPENYAELDSYLVGRGNLVPVGHIRSQIVVYAPSGALLTEVETEALPGVGYNLHGDLWLAAAPLTLAPGEETSISYRIEVPASLPGEPQVRVTPGPRDTERAVVHSTCE